jgi:hypothetical protein
MAEYANTGPGAHAGARSSGNISKNLSAQEYSLYDKPQKVFTHENGSPDVDWIDWKPEEM